MEGILVLKLLTDSLNLGHVLDSIENALKDEGYLNARVSIGELYTLRDTLYVLLKVRRGFPYVSRYAKVRGYIASLPSYRVLASAYRNRLVKMGTLKEELKGLDAFFGNESTIHIRGDTLVIQNRSTPRIRGNLYISDSINGSIEARWDGVDVYYSDRKSILSLTVGLLSRHPTALTFNYRREGRETYRLTLDRPGISSGIKYAPGLGLGLATRFRLYSSSGRIEYLDGWTLEGIFKLPFLKIGAYYSETDTAFIGGAMDIAGYPENSLSASRYLYIKAEIPVMKRLFVFLQPHWIGDGRGNYSLGAGFRNDNLELIIAKAGGNPPTLHLVIRN